MSTSISPAQSLVQFPLGPFVPHPGNPVLTPRGQSWESASVYNAAAVVVDGRMALLYRAHADDVVSHVGLAFSHDGFEFERRDQPVLSPTEPYEAHGCEDPRVTEIEGTYYLTYTGYDGVDAVVCLATSTDLVHWTKHGPMFPGFNTFHEQGREHPNGWSKGAAILREPVDGRYLLFFGEGSIYYAWSHDLIHWTPCPQDQPVLTTRPGTYMASLVETGPQPILTSNGLILLMHNAAVIRHHGDNRTVDYTCGQALIDPHDPGTTLATMTHPWLRPRTYEETHGLVSNVTFVEGLAYFHGTWFAYYGQSDSTLGVATYTPSG